MNGCEKLTNGGGVSSPSTLSVVMDGKLSTETKMPDADTIKMFVGQVPRSYDENDLLKIFGQYGPVHQLNILRDKSTNQSRGCCFVTYYHRRDAVAAQCALHDVVTLPGMHHPVQMKPADAENRNDRKLFVGMLNKSMAEQDVQALFSPYGLIEDCAVLKDGQGQSRGCAFVTFASRQSALNAIKSLHHSQTMEGCSSALVVKLADTQKDKELKKSNVANPLKSALTTPAGLSGLSLGQPCSANPLLSLLQTVGLNSLNTLTLQQQLALLASNATTTSNIPNVPNLPNWLNTGINPNLMQNLPALTLLNSFSGTNRSSTLNSGQQSIVNNANFSLSSLMPGNNALLSALPMAQQQSSPSFFANNAAAIGNAATGDACSQLSGINQNVLNSLANDNNSMEILSNFYGKLNQYTANLANLSSSTLQGHQGVGKQIEGPDGCNLFIYHLPQEFTDLDLVQTFQPFGNVLSARVFIDKQTNLSKCFGFVSYDNAVSSQSAIQAMNGFQIGTKRLKVQLKRSKNDNKPYSHNNIAITN